MLLPLPFGTGYMHAVHMVPDVFESRHAGEISLLIRNQQHAQAVMVCISQYMPVATWRSDAVKCAGAFVAGVPLQPIILQYGEVKHPALLALPCHPVWAP